MDDDAINFNNAKKGERYYAVNCRCGHVKPKKYVAIVFPIIAANRKEAAFKARKIPRVKHNKKNAIIDCWEISEDEYLDTIKKNNEDPYLKCKNIQEQRQIEGFENRILNEEEVIKRVKNKEEKKDICKYKQKKQKELISALTKDEIKNYLMNNEEVLHEEIYK